MLPASHYADVIAALHRQYDRSAVAEPVAALTLLHVAALLESETLDEWACARLVFKAGQLIGHLSNERHSSS